MAMNSILSMASNVPLRSAPKKIKKTFIGTPHPHKHLATPIIIEGTGTRGKPWQPKLQEDQLVWSLNQAATKNE